MFSKAFNYATGTNNNEIPPPKKQIPGTVITVDNRRYTTPVFQGINTNEYWNVFHKEKGRCPDYTLTDKAKNPHALAGEKPEKFWIEAGALIQFLKSCMGLDGSEDGKELYELASQDRWYSYDQTFPPNGNKMSWYKFNRTYTENLTRYKGKGVSFCTRGNITDAGSVPHAKDASCMISYMYDSDPKETLDVLVKLLGQEVIAEDERIFFCSFANFQVNHDKFPTESHGGLYCPNAPNVSEQVKDNPFEKIAGFVDKFVIMHTGGETDIYSRKWCCFELSKAMEKVERDDNTKVIMVGSEAYREKVVEAISRFDPKSLSKEYDDAANAGDIPKAWKDLMGQRKISPKALTLMQVLAPADTKNSIAQENQPPENPRVKGPINAMLDESIELIVVGKLDPGTQVAIPGEVVKGFLAANRLINSIRMRYQASILTGGSGLVQYVSSANRPNAIPGGNVIFAGDVTQVIAEEGTLPLFPTGGIAQKVKNFGAANYFGAAMGYVNQNEKKGLGMSLEDMNRRQGANKRTSPKPASRRHMKEELRWTEKHMQEKWDNRESDDIEMWIDENNKYKKDVYEL